MTAPLMPKATAVWLVENTTLTFRQISVFCEIHELEIQAMADGDVSGNIRGLSPVDNGQLTWEEIHRCEADKKANLEACEMERNVKARNLKAKKVLSPSQRQDKPNAIAWVLKNYPEIKDTLVCKLIGTTKSTIQAIRDGSHKDASSIKPKNPVTIGLCSEADIEKALLASQPKPKAEKKVKVKKQTYRLSIEGMMCLHCKKKVLEALSSLPGVVKVSVDLETNSASVIGRVEKNDLVIAVNKAGFKAK